MLDDPRDFVLLFDKPSGETKLVAWTTAAEPRKVALPASAGEFEVTGSVGDSKGKITANEFGIVTTLSGDVAYFNPTSPNKLLASAAAWQRAPLELVAAGPNPKEGIRREPNASLRRIACPDSDRLVQETSVAASNPLFLMLIPLAGGNLTVQIRDPSAEGFKGHVTLNGIEALEVDETSKPIELKAGQTDATLTFPAKAEGADYSVGVQLTDDAGQLLVEVPQQNFGGLPDMATDGAYKLFTDGDAKIKSEQSLTRDAPLEAAPVPGVGVLRLTYKSDAGWKFWRIALSGEEARKISGEAKVLGLWVWGDGNGGLIRLRFTDSTGQTFQPSGPTIDWKGWKYVTIPMDHAAVAHSHWGGVNDGTIHYPVKWDTVFLLDRDSKRPADGAVYVAGPTLIR
jgi:hypothetical protein